jgi:O-antigen/teichoic acid export membrane protein
VGAGYLARQLFTRRLWPAAAFSPRQALQVAIDSLPLAASGVLSTLLARLDALILAAMATLTAVGIYGAAYRLIEGTFFIGWAFGAAMFPMLSRLEKDSQPSLNRVFSLGARISLAGMFPAGAVFIVFPAPLIDLVYGSQFDAAVVTTRWLGLVAAVNGLASFGIFALLARNLKGAMVRSCGLALVVNVILNLALIPLYGANGAAIAMAAANVVLAAVALGIAIRHIGPVSGVRVAALTAVPFALMAGTRMLLGETWPGLIVGLAAYGVGLLLAHHWLFRGDTHIVRDWIRTRRLGTAEA